MGYASREENVLACLQALESVLAAQGRPVARGPAETAAREVFDVSPGPHGTPTSRESSEVAGEQAEALGINRPNHVGSAFYYRIL